MSPDLRSTLRAAAAPDPREAGDPIEAPDLHAIRARGRQLTRRRRASVTAVTVPVVAFACVTLFVAPGPLGGLLVPTPTPIPAGPAATSPATTPPSTERPASDRTTLPGVTVPGVAWPPVGDGRVIAYLHKITVKEILYDPAQWVGDCEPAFTRHEPDNVYQWNVEDLCVRNDSALTRIDPVSPDVVVIPAPEGGGPARESLEWLRIFRETTPDENHWLYWLTFEDNVITKIEQVNPSTN